MSFPEGYQDILPVLDLGYVRIIDVMGSDLSVVNAARASFMKDAPFFREEDKKLIHYLAVHEHTSPFRHAMVSFEIKAPLMVARQWFKYRVGSAHTSDVAEFLGVEFPAELIETLGWRGQGDDGGDGQGDLLQARNEASRRYVTLKPEFYVPEFFRGSPPNKKQGSSEKVPEILNAEAINRLLKVVETCLENYEWALAQGIAPEQSRLYLPAYSLYTTWRWTASLQAVAHFLNQRLKQDAQWEIGEYAAAIYSLAQEQFPHSLGNLMQKD